MRASSTSSRRIPRRPDRLKIARANARQFTAPGDVARDKDSYLASIDGLPYGEDPSEGYVRGRRFLHPRLGFTFTAPDRFTLENTAQAVLGVRDSGNLALRLDVVRVPGEQTLGQYLDSGWIENVDDKSIEEFEINGLPTATALAKGDQWSFRLYAIRFGGEVYRFIFAAKQLTPDADRAFRYSVTTFRRMSESEISQARPLRLHVVTRAARRHGGTPRRPHAAGRPPARALPHHQRAEPGRPAQAGRQGEDRHRMTP